MLCSSNLLFLGKFRFSLFFKVYLLRTQKSWDWFVFDSQIVRVELQGAAAFLYSRLVPLVLLLVEGNWKLWNIAVCFTWNLLFWYHFTLGSTPIDIGEHGWEMLLVVKKTTQESVSRFQLLGFAAVHNFYHYPESIRLRISQVGPLTAALSICFIYMCSYSPEFTPWTYSLVLLGA